MRNYQYDGRVVRFFKDQGLNTTRPVTATDGSGTVDFPCRMINGKISPGGTLVPAIWESCRLAQAMRRTDITGIVVSPLQAVHLFLSGELTPNHMSKAMETATRIKIPAVSLRPDTDLLCGVKFQTVKELVLTVIVDKNFQGGEKLGLIDAAGTELIVDA